MSSIADVVLFVGGKSGGVGVSVFALGLFFLCGCWTCYDCSFSRVAIVWLSQLILFVLVVGGRIVFVFSVFAFS